MTDIIRLTETAARAHLGALVDLLTAVVDDGASVGFLRPLDPGVAREYWEQVLAAVAKDTRILLAARSGDDIVGSVQLDLCERPNSRHRAEVLKLIVPPPRRRQGIARGLMHALEREARAAGRSLLVLDTEARSAGEPFYESMQWQRAGSIPGYALSTDGVPTPNTIYYKAI